MNKFMALILILGIAFGTTSCGKKTKNQSSKELNVASSQLNSKDFEGAISTLERAIESHPANKLMRIKLAHAYAGAGGFEAVKFSTLIKDISEMKIKKEVSSILKEIETLFKSVPTLTRNQRTRLDQAIQLYNDLGLDPHTTSKENNFKWGTLHTYRLLSNLKEVSTFVRVVSEDSEQFTKSEIQDFLVVKGDIISKDFYQSYLLFRNSFTKLQKIAMKVEDLIKGTFENKDFKIKIDSKAKTYKAFINDIIKDNKDIFAKALVEITKKIDLLDIEGSVEDILVDFKTNKQDVKERAQRLEFLARMFLDNVVLKNPTKVKELESIFNEDLEKEFEMALKYAIADNSAEPIKELLRSKESSIRVITESWKILNEEFKSSHISAIADPDVKILVSYINKEKIKDLIKRSQNTEKEIAEVIEDASIESEQVTQSKLDELNAKLERDVQELSNDIKPLVNEVEDAFESTDEQMDNRAQPIIEDTIDYIEQD